MFAWKSARALPRIEFMCAPQDRGVIAEPIPAKAALPDWFRRLPARDPAHVRLNDTGLTVKRCMPFLDAMTTGWLLPIAASLKLEISECGARVDAGWEFDRTLVSNHGAHQVAGNPREPRPPIKFHNYWTVRTAPGWSCLFLPPLNRPNPAFEVFSGVVDTDSYVGLIHFPFTATAPDGLYAIEKGTPIAQVIPFRRDDAAIEAVIREETEEDAARREKTHRLTTASEGWYRTEARAKR